MMRVPNRDMSVHLAYLDLHLAIVAQGVAYSPDVADDMIGRMSKLLDESLMRLAEYGLLDTDEDDEDDEEVAQLVKQYEEDAPAPAPAPAAPAPATTTGGRRRTKQ